MNDTILHLPSGDFTVLHEEELAHPENQKPLLRLMLDGANFGRAFPHLQKIAQKVGVAVIRDDTETRDLLRQKLAL